MIEFELETAVAPSLRPEPEILRLPDLCLAGLEIDGDARNQEINTLWEAFLPRMPELISEAETCVTFGVYDPHSLLPRHRFTYLSGVQVNPGAPLPQGMSCWYISAQIYAVLPAYTIPDLAPLTRHFYEAWLPTARRWQMVDAPILELYPTAYPINPTILVYFPIQPR